MKVFKVHDEWDEGVYVLEGPDGFDIEAAYREFCMSFGDAPSRPAESASDDEWTAWEEADEEWYHDYCVALMDMAQELNTKTADPLDVFVQHLLTKKGLTEATSVVDFCVR